MPNSLGVALVLVALGILLFPGVMINNLAGNGLVVAQTQSITCQQNGLYNCQISGNVGCQANPTYCQLNGSSISVLNQHSPFTQLFQGNIFGFFTGLTNPQQGIEGGRGPFDNLGGLFYTADCSFPTAGGPRSQTLRPPGQCTQTNPDNSNTTEANVAKWQNWNFNQSGALSNLQFYRLGNGTFPMTCSFVTQINYTALTNGPGWTYYGCDVSRGSHVITNQVWSLLVALPVNVGPLPVAFTHEHVFIQLQPNADFDPGVVVPGDQWDTVKYENWFQTFKGILISGGSFTSNQYFQPALNAPMLGFLFGFVLLIIGIGMNFNINGTFLGTGGGFGAGVNQQGTRLAQSMGIALVIWSPLYSEFSSWFSTGNLPYGLDGAGGIVSLFLTGAFFVGVFVTAMTWT